MTLSQSELQPFTFLGSKLIRVLVVTSIIFLFNASFIQAQDKNRPPDDIVHLKDGSIYKGQIIEESDGYVYMVILDGQTISIPQIELRRMLSGKNYLLYSGRRFHCTKGFFWNVKMGFGVEEESTSEHFSFMMGYRFSKRLSAGLGLGSELSTTKVAGFDVESMFTSYFAYGRYYLTNNRQRLYTYGRMGYGVGPRGENESGRHSGGFQAQGGLGIHFSSRKRSKFILSLGYHTQYTNGEQFFVDGIGSEVKVQYEDLWVNQLVLKFGMEFR